MKIVLDPQIFNDQKFGGISRYYTEIYKGLLQKQNVNVQLPLQFTENVHIKDLISKNLFLYDFFITIGLFKKSIIRKLKRKNIQSLKNILSHQQFDLFIPTYYNTDFLDYIGDKPFVLTVYDMIHEKFPQYFLDDPFTAKNKRILLEKATRIIAVSHNTKKDIVTIYPEIDASKIIVVYHGNSMLIQKSYRDLPTNYLLFVGSRFGYKNFDLLLKSCKNILQQEKDLYLVCAGGGNFSNNELKLIGDLQITKKVKQINFNENQLGFIYNRAKIFIFPSQYEGFGIPVLEAMSCGCPTILSASSSFPEVAEDAGVFFENNNEKDLQEKIMLLLKNEIYRKSIINLGYVQAEKFSWDYAVDQCLEVYKKAINC